MVTKTEWMRQNRARRKALGLCIDCGEPLDNFGTSCNSCKAKRKEQRSSKKEKYNELTRKYKEKRKKQGLCVSCGIPLSDSNFVSCEACREKARIYGQEYSKAKELTPEEIEKQRMCTRTIRTKRISLGLCPYCGDPMDRLEGLRCNKCREKYRVYRKEYYQKRKRKP